MHLRSQVAPFSETRIASVKGTLEVEQIWTVCLTFQPKNNHEVLANKIISAVTSINEYFGTGSRDILQICFSDIGSNSGWKVNFQFHTILHGNQ